MPRLRNLVAIKELFIAGLFQCGDGSTISSEAMRDGIPPRPK
jgi:hypothetical protein